MPSWYHRTHASLPVIVLEDHILNKFSPYKVSGRCISLSSLAKILAQSCARRHNYWIRKKVEIRLKSSAENASILKYAKMVLSMTHIEKRLGNARSRFCTESWKSWEVSEFVADTPPPQMHFNLILAIKKFLHLLIHNWHSGSNPGLNISTTWNFLKCWNRKFFWLYDTSTY